MVDAKEENDGTTQNDGDDDPYVNPEPPQEIQEIQQADLIGNTMFSKHWLFGLLLKLIEKVDNDSTEEEENEDSREESVKELDADFEKELCDLWDMTVERDVCLVLDEFNAFKIFEGYLKKFDATYPRAVELIVGIMVNMASLSKAIATKLVENTSLITYMISSQLNQMNDVPSLIQVIRLLTVITRANEKIEDNEKDEQDLAALFVHKYFFDESSETNTDLNDLFHLMLDQFNFIFESSLNPQLLDYTCAFINSLLDLDGKILNAFAGNKKFVPAIHNAAITRMRLNRVQKSFTGAQFSQVNASKKNTTTQSRATNSTGNRKSSPDRTPHQPSSTTVYYVTQQSEEDISSLDSIFNKYFLCLQSLSTCELGAMSLCVQSSLIFELIGEYLDKCLATFNDWEIKSSRSLKSSICCESLQNFICLISVVNCIISNPDLKRTESESESHEKFDLNVEKCVEFGTNLFTLSKYYLHLLKGDDNNDDDDDDENQATNGERNKSSFFQMENFEQVAKSNMRELIDTFNSLIEKKNDDHDHNDDDDESKSNKNLIKLIKICENLL